MINYQKEEMVEYMFNHPNFARNRVTELGCTGSDQSKIMWKQLRKNVNDLTGPKFKVKDLKKVIIKAF